MALAGALDAVRARAASVQARAEAAVATARQVAEDGRALLRARVAESAASARRAVDERVVRLLATWDEAVEYTLSTAESTRSVVVGVWEDVRTKGVRSAASEAMATLDIQGHARVMLEGGRSRLVATRALAGEKTEAARLRALAAATRVREKAVELRTAAGERVSQKSFQTTAAASAGGAAALGAGGAVAGLATGSLLGAASGVPLALFTFGLSIPVGAMVGGGAGVVVGTTLGAATGAVGGGAAGYGAYCKKDQIRSAADAAFAKAGEGAELAKGKAFASVSYVKDAALAARARLGRAGTGGSEESD